MEIVTYYAGTIGKQMNKQMKKIILIISLMIVNFGYGHDLRMAIFEISQANGYYVIDITFDKNNIRESLITSFGRVSYQEEYLQQSIKDYLAGNFKIIINGECISPEIKGLTFDEEHLRIHAVLPVNFHHISTIEVFNTCLLENRGHMNIVKSNFNGQVRTFRLTKDRVSTIIDYR